jgi:hypothetical protein
MRRWVILAVVTAVVAAGCTDDPVRSIPVDTGLAVDGDDAITTPDTVDSVPAIVPTIATDVPVTITTVAGGPLGGVTIDDPMPPQVDAAGDPAAADVAVRYAYQHWLLVDLDKDLRAKLVENGEANADAIDQGLQDARGIIEFGRLHVVSVVFTAADRADVSFDVTWQDGPSPIFPDRMTGTALFVDGSWRITGRTLCVLAFGTGQDCAGGADDLPDPADALVLLHPPDGLVFDGGQGAANTVIVPGQSSWHGPNDSSFLVSTRVLAGISNLAPEDGADVLSTSQFLGEDGVSFAVGGRPGLVVQNGQSVRLAFIRPDDIVVIIDANGMTLTQVGNLAFALVPADG